MTTPAEPQPRQATLEKIARICQRLFVDGEGQRNPKLIPELQKELLYALTVLEQLPPSGVMEPRQAWHARCVIEEIIASAAGLPDPEAREKFLDSAQAGVSAVATALAQVVIAAAEGQPFPKHLDAEAERAN